MTGSLVCPICSRLNTGLSRRTALGALAGAGAFALSGPGGFAAAANPRRIDTHCHVVPPSFVKAHHMENVPDFKRWSVSAQLEQMDSTGIAVGMQGINSPGVDLVDKDAAIALARDCNEFAAKVMSDHPTRYGLMAALPMLHPDAALAEIAYGFDTLHADGASMTTSYQGKLLGDPLFDPVLAELNRRKAVVFPHPQVISTDRSMITRVLEMPFDTARAIYNLILTGTLKKYPEIKWIFAHGGGALPVLWQRVNDSTVKNSNAMPEGLQVALKDVHFDVVGVANPLDFALIRGLWGINRLTFGTDWPFVEAKVTAGYVDTLQLSPVDYYALNRGNAEKLFPRLMG